jgi:nicotinamidase/pyrazinamidase
MPGDTLPGRTAADTRTALQAGDALLVVDVQRDFLPGGSLAVPHGDAVVAPLNGYMDDFAARHLPIFLTRDWHPEHHCSFHIAGGRWPVHCVRGTPGAQWAAQLRIPPEAQVISKATDERAEAYSAFSGTALGSLLRESGVRRVFVGGLATEFCVHDTVIDARALGFEVVVLGDAIRAVEAHSDRESQAMADMIRHGANLA